MRYRIEVDGATGDAAVRQFIEAWLETPGLRELVEEEGGTWPAGTLQQRVAQLHAFSERWDFRGGAERMAISASASRHAAAAASHRVGQQFGMTSSEQPLEPDYQHALVLGGTALANVYRVRWLFDLIRAGLRVERPVALTALRDLSDSEREVALERSEVAAVVGAAKTEFDVMTNAMAAYSGSQPDVRYTPSDNPNCSSAHAAVGDGLVLAAPSADPARRANTRDNYDAYAQRIADGDSVLVVTSSIYLPYQFFIAIQALGWRRPLTIEAVGFPPEWMKGVLTGPENILQELRSALFGASKALEALAAI